MIQVNEGHFPGATTPPWRRGGSFVFLGTHTPHRQDTGLLVTRTQDLPGELDKKIVRRGNLYVDVLRDSIVAQTTQMIANISASLEAGGSGLDRIVHLRVFVRDMIDELFVVQTLQSAFGGVLPSAEIVQASGANVAAEIMVHADAVAITNDAAYRIEHRIVDELGALTHPFPTATQAGPYIFTSSFPGTTQGGAIPASLDDLGEPERAIVRELGWLPASHRSFVLQQAAMWGHARLALDSFKAPLDSVFHHLAWLRIDMRRLGNGSITRLVAPLVKQYCLTCFPIAGLRRPDALIEGRFTALDPRFGIAKTVSVPIHGISNSYYGAMRAGELFVAAGEVPIDTARQKIIMRASDYPGRAGLEFGMIHRDRRIDVEAAYVFELHAETLKAYAIDLAHVAHQTFYLCNVADRAAVLAAEMRHLGGAAPPATAVVPIEGASPFQDTRLEVELMTAVPAS